MKLGNRTSLLGAALALALTIGGAALAREAPTMTVAVIDFTNQTSSANWWNGDVGNQLADVLSNELSATGDFKVVERQKIDAVLAEQDLAASSRMRPGSTPHTGNVTGAQYLVTGSVAAYTEDTSNTGGGVNIAGFRVGGGKSEAYIAIDLRVIDAETSEVVYSRTVEGHSSSGGVNLRGFVSGVGGDFAHNKKTPASKAVRAALIEASDYLDCVMVKRDGCEANYQKKEQHRRDNDKKVLDLD
ncbi:CsgG/HfaB family protein [Rhodanobacter sp. AS-Z3]|uniref:CsgG/HfaB family protein n=1 Tax=Rhodanobacter sp. AS-Z3 TaxID=3031330 RepID=UPI002479D20B|nr:CsgG/HfaB family protein [Rhodanobacter sp. AS-Z3]WEN14842.1 CsgG/HfaB family protein [Rhodanobacter sp. AS-Z3]